MSSPFPDVKLDITADETPRTPKKSPSKKKSSSSTSVKDGVVGNGSPSKGDMKEMRKIALETLFEHGVRGETMSNIAAKSGLSKQQVGDLFRMKRLGNIRYKVMALVESGSI